MTPFQQHGIEHLSASSINLYRSSPSLWCVRYLFGIKDEYGAAAEAGLQMEKEVGEALKGRQDVSPLALELAREATKFGELEAEQEKIELSIPTIPVPIIGYTDFTFSNAVFDTKWKRQMVKEIPLENCIQGALYTFAKSRPTVFGYGQQLKSDYRTLVLELENPDKYLTIILRTAAAIERALAFSKTPEGVASLFSPDIDSNFRWGADSKAFACELWGLT